MSASNAPETWEPQCGYERELGNRATRRLKELVAGGTALVKAVARGHVRFEELTSGRAASITEIAERERVSDRFVSILLNLAKAAESRSAR